MMQRTTLTASAEDLDVFRREARRRKVPLNAVLKEVVHEAASDRRNRLLRRDFGLFDGPGTDIARQMVEDEHSPVAGRLRS